MYNIFIINIFCCVVSSEIIISEVYSYSVILSVNAQGPQSNFEIGGGGHHN